MEELEEYSEVGDDPKCKDFDDIVWVVNYVGGLSYLMQLFLLMCNWSIRSKEVISEWIIWGRTRIFTASLTHLSTNKSPRDETICSDYHLLQSLNHLLRHHTSLLVSHVLHIFSFARYFYLLSADISNVLSLYTYANSFSALSEEERHHFFPL